MTFLAGFITGVAFCFCAFICWAVCRIAAPAAEFVVDMADGGKP